MDKKDWVVFEIRDNYPHIRKLRELLDQIYGGYFELSVCRSKNLGSAIRTDCFSDDKRYARD
jgi:hypothetical protein